MPYSVAAIFHTLQGEGAQTGRPAVFLRLAGCNLWSGREADRADAACAFCDTDFQPTARYADADALADAVAACWAKQTADRAHACVVVTGGEPLLQLDRALLDALHARGFFVAVESNGTLAAPAGLDWLCISPKAGAPLVQTAGDELKVVWPQAGLDLSALEALDFRWFFLQPVDHPDHPDATDACLAVCRARPRWWLSVQVHKHLGLP